MSQWKIYPQSFLEATYDVHTSETQITNSSAVYVNRLNHSLFPKTQYLKISVSVINYVSLEVNGTVNTCNTK